MYVFHTLICVISCLIWLASCGVVIRDRFIGTQILSYGNGYDRENHPAFWREIAQNTLRDQVLKTRNENIAKNVILFMGDGMSLATVAAARIYLGQEHGYRGDESLLSFDKFPYTGLSKTYCADAQVADSACTATAYLCGIKGNFNTTGVSASVKYNDCAASRVSANQVDSIIAWAQRAGKSTGIVTTTRITHASPAGTYAHVSNRDFECDTDVLSWYRNPAECEDIASQMVRRSPGNKINVIFGGGRTKFIPKTERDVDGNIGERSDGVNLIDEWKKGKDGAKVVFDRKGLENIDLKTTEHLLGLFAPNHLSFNLDANRTKEPSLLEMTQSAIELLRQNPNGFVLFVEGGRIDHAHHEARAHKALDETVEFSKAIEGAQAITDSSDTLIVVTSDHSHTMTFSGYSDRGQNILGLAQNLSDVDMNPYTILSYANGMGAQQTYNSDGTRQDPSNIIFNKNYQYPGIVPMLDETHGGDDVGIFASGPFSHLFGAVLEQHAIPHIIGYAACIGDGESACESKSGSESLHSYCVIFMLLLCQFFHITHNTLLNRTQ